MSENGALRLEVQAFTDARHWRWRLTDAGGKFLADHQVALEPGQSQHAALLDLEGYVKHHAAPDKWPDDEARVLREVGAWVAKRVLGDVAQGILDYGTPATVRVVVPPEAEALLYLPLEAACVKGKPLALHDVSLVFEVLGEEPSVRRRGVGEKLRMLAVFSLPVDASALALRRERYALQQLIRRIAQTYNRAIELRVVQYGVTREALAELLEAGAGWDVIHFSGHGLPGELALEKLDGHSDHLDAQELLGLLRPARGRLKLVTLAACLSAAATVAETLRLLGIQRHLKPPATATEEAAEPSPLTPLPPLGEGSRASALAQQLVRELDCAVLAMRYPVGDDFAIALGAELYERLLGRDQRLPRALQLALPAALRGGPGPGVPPLFGRRGVGLVLQPPQARREKPVEVRVGLAYFPEEPERFVGRLDAMRRASQALAPESRQTGVLFYGMAGAGKTTCALELAYRYREEPRFQHFVWHKAPDEGTDIAAALLNLAVAMETQIPGLKMVHLVDRAEEFKAWLPQLSELLERRSILIVLDNLESLLWPDGSWRDERWRGLVEALLDHSGLSRTVLTSRRRPAALGRDGRVQVQAIHALSLDEAVLLARELPNLGRLLAGKDVGLALVARTLKVVQGHPKLIELADKQAGDAKALAKQLEEVAAGWAGGEGRLEAFFQRGESPYDAQHFLAALSGWTRGLVGTLPAASRTLFGFLCALEEGDRQSAIVEANWNGLWQRLGLDGEAPDLAATLGPLTGAGLVEEGARETGSLRIHPGVAEAGRAQAGEALLAAVDAELADFWIAVYQKGREEELRGGGQLVLLAGRSAAPYLLRQRRWGEASMLLDRVLLRDRSPGTAAAVLPWLRRIAEETQGTERELIDAGVLANALWKAGRWREAEAMERARIQECVKQGQFRPASTATGRLVNILMATGRAEEALERVEEKKGYTRDAGLGPWTQLSDEGWRLQLLNALGRYDEVPAAVQELRQEMAALPEESEQEEAAVPWNVREGILDAGRSAAMRLERWEDALALSTEIVVSTEARGAPPLEVARARFNDYGPLLSLRRYGEARALLDACRQAFEREKYLLGLGSVFSALADLEDELGHYKQAEAFEETALRYTYLCGDPEDCAISHNNLSTYQKRSGGERKTALAHRLAAGVIGLQSASGRLTVRLRNLAIDFAEFAPEPPPFPASFDEMCDIVERVEGVRFRELFDRLPQRAASGDGALQAVIELAAKAVEQPAKLGEEEQEGSEGQGSL